MGEEVIEEIDVEPVPEPVVPDEGELDPNDTYTEGVDTFIAEGPDAHHEGIEGL